MQNQSIALRPATKAQRLGRRGRRGWGYPPGLAASPALIF
jgi:hypothetical protein